MGKEEADYVEFTMDEVVREAKLADASPRLVGDLKAKVLPLFKSTDEFLHCDVTKLCWSTRRLGKHMEELVTKLKDRFFVLRQERLRARTAEEALRLRTQETQAEYERLCRELNPVVSLEELQALVAMMQLMNLKTVDLSCIRQFLDSLLAKRRDRVAADGEAEKKGG